MAAGLARCFYDELRGRFWSERFWLPENVTWADLGRRDDGVFVPDLYDLWVVVPAALLLLVVRLMWERYIALPIGRLYKISETLPKPVIANSLLEDAFKKNKRFLPEPKQVENLSSQLGWTPRQVERWWRHRRAQSKLCAMQRFKETSWRFVFYFSAFWIGLYIVSTKPYFWDTRHCYYGFPRQHVPTDVYWYYIVEMGFYVSLLLSLFMDTRRKDFLQMILHHIVTLGLMTFSWTTNLVPIGALVLCLHDTVDSWMEGAKLAKHCQYHKLCDILFVVFTVLWFVTRLVIYPFWVVYSACYESQAILGPFMSNTVFTGLLCTLQVMHVIWFYMIMRILCTYIVKGQVAKDDRSESEPESGTDEDSDVDVFPNEQELKQAHTNNGDANGHSASFNGKIASNGLVKRLKA